MPPSIRRALAVAWTLLILVLCWTPRRVMPVGEEHGGFLRIPHLDKLVHGGLFAGFAFLWVLAGFRARWVVAAGLILALVSELGQELPVVNRDADWFDGLADGVGLLVGVVVVGLLTWQRRERIRTPSVERP